MSKKLNKLFGVVNLETCSVVCYADAGFANAEHEKSQCGLVCCLTHSTEFAENWHDHQLAKFHQQESCQIHTGSRGDTLCLKGSNQLNGFGIC